MINKMIYIGSKLRSNDERNKFLEEILNSNKRVSEPYRCEVEFFTKDWFPDDGEYLYKIAWNISGFEEAVKAFTSRLESIVKKYGLKKLTKEEFED